MCVSFAQFELDAFKELFRPGGIYKIKFFICYNNLEAVEKEPLSVVRGVTIHAWKRLHNEIKRYLSATGVKCGASRDKKFNCWEMIRFRERPNLLIHKFPYITGIVTRVFCEGFDVIGVATGTYVPGLARYSASVLCYSGNTPRIDRL